MPVPLPDSVWLSALALLGLALGSFLSVLVARVPLLLAEDAHPGHVRLLARLSWPPSHCPHCQQRLRLAELLPLLSWLCQRGRCRHCQQPIAWRYPLLEALMALLSVMLGSRYGLTATFAAALLCCATLLALAWIDAETFWLPDLLTLPLLWAGLLFASLASPWQLTASVWGAAVGYAGLAGLNAGYRAWRGQPGLGGGDAKLLAALGAWHGGLALPWLLTLAALGGLIWAVCTGPLRARRALAFGPFLAMAGIALWLWPLPLWLAWMEY